MKSKRFDRSDQKKVGDSALRCINSDRCSIRPETPEPHSKWLRGAARKPRNKSLPTCENAANQVAVRGDYLTCERHAFQSAAFGGRVLHTVYGPGKVRVEHRIVGSSARVLGQKSLRLTQSRLLWNDL